MSLYVLGIFSSLRIRFAAMLTLAAGAAFVAEPAAAFSWQPNRLQYYLLPPYCQARLSDHALHRQGQWRERFPINEREIALWRSRIGEYLHIHHYCAGLGWLSAAESPSMLRRMDRSRNWAFRQALEEIGYTINRSNPRSPLWSEMNIAQAKAKAGLGQSETAIKQLLRLREQAPRNPNLYVELGRILDQSGKTEEAIAVLNEALPMVSEKGPLLFHLARYYYDIGDIARAAELTPLAEQAGMKMDSLRERLGTSAPPPASESAANP